MTAWDAILEAAERGAPLGPKDLLAFDPAEVRRLLDSGRAERRTMLFGGQETVVILPASTGEPPPGEAEDVEDVDDDVFDQAEVRYLEAAYTSGVSFAEMKRRLKRSATEILREAWARKFDRPGALYAKSRRERRLSRRDFEDPVPAWRIKRFRGLLEEARLRGQNPADHGEDLTHRALRRAFELGRLQSVASRKAGLHFEAWTTEDYALLEELREQGLTIAEIARRLERTVAAVNEKIMHCGLKRQKAWHEDEDLLLIGAIERGSTGKEAAELLPGRSALACRQRALFLLGPRGFAPWRPDEREDLKRAVLAGENLREWAREHGRGICGVRWQCRNMGLRHPSAVRPYSAEEDEEIREAYRRGLTARAIAARLGRSVSGVFCRASKIGAAGRRLHGGTGKGATVKNYEIAYIRARAAQGWTGPEIAARMNRSLHMVYRISARHGICWPRRGPRKRKGMKIAVVRRSGAGRRHAAEGRS